MGGIPHLVDWKSLGSSRTRLLEEQRCSYCTAAAGAAAVETPSPLLAAFPRSAAAGTGSHRHTVAAAAAAVEILRRIAAVRRIAAADQTVAVRTAAVAHTLLETGLDLII